MKRLLGFILSIIMFLLLSGCVSKNYTTPIQQKSSYTISSGRIVKVDEEKGIIVANIEIDEMWNEGRIEHKDTAMFDPFFLLDGGLVKGEIANNLDRSYTYAKTQQVNCRLEQLRNLKVVLVGRTLNNPRKEIILPIKNKMFQGNTITIYVDKNIFSSNADKDILLKVNLPNQNKKTFDVYQVEGYHYKEIKLKNSLELVVKSSTSFMY